ncbi:MAG TPA: cell envelope integrity protein CreD [Chiayiivirga sp.]|nr:cell envelope integrity protein CreD [Chiayiivirga sp.]
MAASSIFHGATFKVLGIGFLALLMLIPLSMVQSLVSEREGRAHDAAGQIASRWGAAQSLAGPVLVVPVKTWPMRNGQQVMVETREFLLPDRLSISAELKPEVRHYGMYSSVVYVAAIAVKGGFRAEDLAALAAEEGEVQWQRAELRVPVADVRGIRRVSELTVDSRILNFGPSADGVADSSAISVPLGLNGAPTDASLNFEFSLDLAGSERFSVLPLARRTEVMIQGAWGDPGFDGAFLPASREVTEQGFKASWQVLDLNRAIATRWNQKQGEAMYLGSEAFGVSLVQTVNAYQQNVRAGKYGVLFLALTFVAFFLFEVLRRLRVHPVQYLLVGAALCTFYVVLLALSEQIGFGLAYMAAATATSILIGGYAAAILGTRRDGLTLAGLMALVYALLYGLVRSEDYALLMGAMALLAALAALMYLTRRVDWYQMAARD